MACYRLYRVSDITRRLEPAEEFDAANDGAAIGIAEQARSHRAAALWSGGRMVQDWKANSLSNHLSQAGWLGLGWVEIVRP